MKNKKEIKKDAGERCDGVYPGKPEVRCILKIWHGGRCRNAGGLTWPHVGEFPATNEGERCDSVLPPMPEVRCIMKKGHECMCRSTEDGELMWT